MPCIIGSHNFQRASGGSSSALSMQEFIISKNVQLPYIIMDSTPACHLDRVTYTIIC